MLSPVVDLSGAAVCVLALLAQLSVSLLHTPTPRFPPASLQYVETDMQQLQIRQRHTPRTQQEQVRRSAA